MTDPPVPNDPDLELVVLSYVAHLDDEQRATVERAAREGRMTFGFAPGPDGALALVVDITQRVLTLDAAAFGFELDEHGEVQHR
jgi:hypothetical protein